MSPTSDEVRIADRDGVRWIELDRPASRNGLTPEINHQLAAGFAGAATAARVVVLTGSGGNFCSGLDLKDAMRRGFRSPEQIEHDLREHFHGLIRAVRGTPIPTIAVIDGAAAGFGCDLALACDLRLCSDRARFGEIFVKRGLMPDGGGSYTLARLIGVGRALELLLTGDLVDAAEAHRLGLANQVWPAAELTERAAAFAERLAKGPPLVHRLVKQAVYAGQDGDLDAALDREAKGQLQCVASADFAEGVGAFLAKREPQFTGK